MTRSEVSEPGSDAPKARNGPVKEPSEAAKRPPSPTRVPSIIVGLVIAAVAGLSVCYLLRPEPLLVQGEVDATRLDIAARVDGRVKEIPVERGQNVAAGAVLVRIDNPETIAKARTNEGGKGCCRGPACQRTRRNTGGNHCRAEGGTGARAGGAGAGAEDL